MSAAPRNNRIAFGLLGVIVFMGAMAWAAVPFYNWFCRVTGYAGTTNTADAGSDVVLDREITVRFIANTARDMPWEFRPMQTSMKLRIGETGLAYYEAYNPSDETVAGTASYNVAPDQAGYYFTKIECFCFTEQVLEPGQRVEMPVTFYVDPDIVDDPDANFIPSITLSYTFHQTELPQAQAALTTAAPGARVN